MNRLREPRFLTNKAQAMLVALSPDVDPPQNDDGVVPIRSTSEGALITYDPTLPRDSIGRLMVKTVSDDVGAFQQLKQSELSSDVTKITIAPDVEPFPSRDATFQGFMTIDSNASSDITLVLRMNFDLQKDDSERVPYRVSKKQLDIPPGASIALPFNTFDFEYNPSLYGAPMPDPIRIVIMLGPGAHLLPGEKIYVTIFFTFTKVLFTGPGNPRVYLGTDLED